MDEILQPTSNPMNLDPQKAIDLENGVNQGVIAPTREELEKVSAAEPVGFTLQILEPSGDWDKWFTTPYDPQSSQGFDTLGCNIFSSVHGCEAIANRLGVIPTYNKNGKTNFSERAACVNSGLTGNEGSSESQWEDGIKKFGLIFGDLWQFIPGMKKAEFFKLLPPELKAKGLEFFKYYDVSFRQIGTDRNSIKQALPYGPVKIFVGTGVGWNNGEPKIIPKTNNPMNHAVLVRKITDFGIPIYDQYAPFLKILSSDYIIYYAFQTIFTKKVSNDRGVMMLPDGHTEAVFVKISSPIKPISEIQNMPDEGLALAKDGRTVLFYSKEGSQANIDKFKEVLEINPSDPIIPSSEL